MLSNGTILGNRYEIVEEIGSGGMAYVYKATDHKLNRFVAVKVMKSEFNNDESFIRKFKREAQAAAGLSNPNIVNVYDVGEDNGVYYFVMELIDGITLKDYIKKKHRLSVREATSIAIQVCMGLAAAHSQGIVHRDIKPQNIIISTDGKVKVTDFGIARAASSNTISANVMGSVHYSSPEQVRGGYSDSKSDIYSLGITLYEMVTGRVPFEGETTVAIAIKHLQDEMYPPSKYVPDIPYSLEQIIYKCTQKSPDRRYNSVNEIIDDLKQSLTDPDGHFVKLAPLAEHAQTVSISPEEMKAIKQSKAGRYYKEQNDEYEYDDNDDDFDDDDGGISSKLEKAMTIGGFIIGAIIICLLIFFIGRAAGFFSFRDKEENPQPAAETVEEPVSTGSNDTVETPNLLGLTREEAQANASELDLGIKYSGEESSEDFASGQICRQDPEAGTPIPRNTTIYFYISSGREQVEIPAVTNMTKDAAITALKAAGFENISVSEESNENVASGNVISIVPAEGTMTSIDNEITLTVSLGSNVSSETVSMPSVRGLNEEAATSILEDMGLQVATVPGYTSELDVGDVMAQDPKSGESVNVGKQVTLTINTGDPETQTQEPGQSSSEEEQVVQGTWKTDVRLDATSEYTGGAYRLTLEQEVNGRTVETVLNEGDSLSFPYELKYNNGANGVSTGVVYLYEMSGGSYVKKAKWTVPFQA